LSREMVKPVPKDQFDSLLQRLLKQKPEETKAIKSTKTTGIIIPPKTAQPKGQQ